MAAVIPGAGQRARMAAGDDFEFGKRRIAGEVFVRKDLEILGMVDGQETHLIHIHHLFERFHKTHAEHACPWTEVLTFHLYIFGGIGDIALSGTDPMTYHPGAKHVSDKAITLAVPNP